MKNYYFIFGIMAIFFSCKKEITRKPTVINSGNVLKIQLNEATLITSQSAELLAVFKYFGDSNVIKKGICWSETPNPTVSNFVRYKGSGIVEIYHKIDSLKSNTKYYIKAFGENINGIFYSNEISFTTGLGIQIITNQPTDVSMFEANCSAEVINNDGLNILHRGFCYTTYYDNPSINDNVRGSLDVTNKYNAKLNNLSNSTFYYIRAYVSTGKSVFYGNTVIITTTKNKYNIGDLVDGGIVFYLDPNGLNGMIAAENNIGSSFWGCEGFNSMGSNRLGLYWGNSNTKEIVENCTTLNIAAKMCDNLVLKGYSDWSLPSKDELNSMYKNLYQKNLGNFQIGNYWTSSQYDQNTAYFQYFNTTTNQNVANKDANSYLIRPVRYY